MQNEQHAQVSAKDVLEARVFLGVCVEQMDSVKTFAKLQREGASKGTGIVMRKIRAWE